MRSIKFPNMFSNTVTNIVEDYDATLQNLKMLLYSEKGELFGDPYYGTNLRKFLYDQNDAILRDLLIDDIYTAIATFMPQVKVNRKDIIITSDGAKITINIIALNRVNFQTDLYSIALLDTII